MVYSSTRNDILSNTLASVVRFTISDNSLTDVSVSPLNRRSVTLTVPRGSPFTSVVGEAYSILQPAMRVPGEALMRKAAAFFAGQTTTPDSEEEFTPLSSAPALVVSLAFTESTSGRKTPLYLRCPVGVLAGLVGLSPFEILDMVLSVEMFDLDSRGHAVDKTRTDYIFLHELTNLDSSDPASPSSTIAGLQYLNALKMSRAISSPDEFTRFQALPLADIRRLIEFGGNSGMTSVDPEPYADFHRLVSQCHIRTGTNLRGKVPVKVYFRDHKLLRVNEVILAFPVHESKVSDVLTRLGIASDKGPKHTFNSLGLELGTECSLAWLYQRLAANDGFLHITIG